ncbi:MAG: M23 family metallopeptidase [Phycisphaerae bacterium]|nr:M23 family metallopeptidase [Phycisphaerae bacterium]
MLSKKPGQPGSNPVWVWTLGAPVESATNLRASAPPGPIRSVPTFGVTPICFAPPKLPNARPKGDPFDIHTWSFPFSVLPEDDWKTGARRFGADRSGGRKHAGCDLYFPEGTAIHALADGVLIQEPYSFYAKTHAVEVRHGNHVVRYGEIKPGSYVGGQKVKQGQVIAKVGHLVGIKVPSDMLHLELYEGTATGALTTSTAPYKRRSDLLDPTKYLNEWSKRLPTPW